MSDMIIEKVKSFEAVLKDLLKERNFNNMISKKIIRFEKIFSIIGITLILVSTPFFILMSSGTLIFIAITMMAVGNGFLISALASMYYISKDLKDLILERSLDLVYPIKDWFTPISNIPEQSIPPFYIEKMGFKTGQILGMEWDGHSHCVFTQDTMITVLREGEITRNDPESVWMSDTPQEYFTHWNLIVRVRGPNVLIAGLGLGLFVHLLALRKDILKIVIVEKSPEIIKMVSPYLPEGPEIVVVNGDFLEEIFKLLKSEEKFNTIICDIWKGIDEESIKLYEACKKVVEETYPNAIHLYWAFQTIHEQSKSSSFLSSIK